MRYTHLGRAGARVSRIALGTMNFGPVIDEAASHTMLDIAVECGITVIDTADVYGGPPLGKRIGHSESIIGDWMTRRGARDEILLSTKVYEPTGVGVNDRGLSALHIRAAVEASLTRLRTDRIDLLQMHHVDTATPADEVLEAMTVLRDQGKILYLGSSNFAGWHLAQFQEKSAATGRVRPVSEQSVYNLTQRTAELEVIPAAAHYGLGFFPWSPLAGGKLSGTRSPNDRVRSAHSTPTDNLGRFAAYEVLADQLHLHPAVLAVAWLLHQPAVTAPVIGPRTPEHLSAAVRALEVALDAATLARLDEIWPGPGGPAPEAYAW